MISPAHRTNNSKSVQVRAVLLDVDGTLVDSNDAHAHAFVQAMREYGFDIEFQRVRPLIGMGSDKLLPAAIDVDSESALGKQIVDRKKQIFDEQHLSTLKPLNGARTLVQQLKARGVELVIATSAGEDELKNLLRAANVDDLIPKRTSSDDADESKPDPDIIVAALQKVRTPGDQTVMIGDTPYDLQAAHRAGVEFIALRSGGWDDRHFAHALAIYDDPQDLLSNLDQHIPTRVASQVGKSGS